MEKKILRILLKHYTKISYKGGIAKVIFDDEFENIAAELVKSALTPVSLDEQSEATVCTLCNGDGEIMFGTTPLVCNCVYRACKL